MKTSDLIKLGLTPEQAARLSRNGQYWKTRFGQVEQAQHDRGVQAFQKIEAQYRQAQKDIEAKIDAWYRRFATNEGITLQEARKMLDAKQLAEFKWDVNDYIRYGQENAISGQWVKELENASARFHISRLEALKVQCQQDVEVLFGSQADIFDHAMRDIYKSGYYHNAFTLQKGFGVGWDFSALDPKHIDRVINTPWTIDGRNFSTRIWDSKNKLIGELDQTLTQNIILGKDPQKAIDAVAARLNVSKSQAGRLVMTEEAYFSSMAQQDCFRELDVDKYEIVATLDNITSDICREMDGKVFQMSQWEIGVTAPPFHPWCRSTTVPAFDDDFGLIGERAAKDEHGKTYYVPANMTYKQWEKAFVHGNKAGVKPVQPVQSVQPKEPAKPASNITFDFKKHPEKFEPAKDMILQLEQQYNTRLQTVTVGAEKAAGSVDMSGATMKLNNSQPETVIHEFAHSIANSKADKYGVTHDSAFWDEIKAIKRKYRRDVGSDTSRWISSYEHGNNDLDEFFAEAFTHAKMREMGLDIPSKYGSDFTYSQQVLDVVNKYFGKGSGTTLMDPVPAEMQATQTFFSSWDQKKIKDFAEDHLKNIGLGQFDVHVVSLRGANGRCTGYFDTGKPVQHIKYELNSKDTRSMPYRVKTAIHESYHLKANGLDHDRRLVGGDSTGKQWSKIEETFTECSAHYMSEVIGVPHTAPSYAEYLIDTLPRLKSAVPDFAACSSIYDFGKVAYKYRFGTAQEVTAIWDPIFQQISGVSHDIIDYSMQYMQYIKDHKDDLIDIALEQMCGGGWTRTDIETNLDAILDKVDNLPAGGKLVVDKGNETTVFNNILINAMDAEGVK